MNALQQYQQSALVRYRRQTELLQLYPQFISTADGLNVMYETIQLGEVKRFIIRDRNGFRFHRCYWQRDLLISVCDFSIYPYEMASLRVQAARELGESLLNQ